ncbi:MAG: PAS domain S-box protein, partial [Pseudomonadota bacterium]
MPELPNSILSNDPESRERRLMDFIELSSDWFWEMGPDFRFTSISSGYQEIIGLNPSHMIGRTRWELAAGNSNDAFWRAHRATHEAHLPYRDFVYQIAPALQQKRHEITGHLPVRNQGHRRAGGSS